MTDPYRDHMTVWGRDGDRYTYRYTATVLDSGTTRYPRAEFRVPTRIPPEVTARWDYHEGDHGPTLHAEPSEYESLYPATPDNCSSGTRSWAQKVNDRGRGDAEMRRAAAVAQARAWEAGQELADFEDDEPLVERIEHGKTVPERPVSFSWM